MGAEKSLKIADLTRLIDLVERLSDHTGRSPSEVIARLSAMASTKPTEPRPQARIAEFVDRVRRIRMRRNELAGADLFRDPACDMLLELYAAHQLGQQVSVSSLCYASGVPATTALRQVRRLEKHGMLIREGDRNDNRRCWVYPTPKALEAVGTAATMLIDQALQVEAGLKAEAEPPDPNAANI